ncbi:hypothetical protein DL96DRAFT_1816403 [Flagelloscypha sp. PMI_526]|nr:hypothetical protein DL96DRAFT_1816403 [Flagelloscypha sp. PMI_526]
MSRPASQDDQSGLAPSDGEQEFDTPVTQIPHQQRAPAISGDLGLPVELLTEVLQSAIPPAFLENDLSFSSWKGNPANRKQQALSFQRVSHGFRDASISLLYSSVTLSSVRQLLALGRALIGSDALASQVTSIACIFPWLPEYADVANTEIEKLFQVCPHLTKLKVVVDTWYLSSFFPSFSQSRITHLDTTRDYHVSIDGLGTLLRILAPSLLYVRAYLQLSSDIPALPVPSPISCPNLRYFRLILHNSSHNIDGLFSRWNFPALRHLALKLTYVDIHGLLFASACRWLGRQLVHLETVCLARWGPKTSWKETESETPIARLFLSHCPSLVHWTTTPNLICTQELSHSTLQQIDILEDPCAQRLSPVHAVEDHFRLFPNCDFPSLRNVRMVSIDLLIFPHVLSATAPYVYGPEPRVFYYPGVCVVSTEYRLFTVQTQFSTDMAERYEREKTWTACREDSAYTWVTSSLERELTMDQKIEAIMVGRFDELDEENSDEDSQDGDYVPSYTEEHSEYSEDEADAMRSVLGEIQCIGQASVMDIGVERVSREELLDIIDGYETAD